MGFRVLNFKLWGSGFGFGCRIWGSRFRVLILGVVLGIRVSALGLKLVYFYAFLFSFRDWVLNCVQVLGLVRVQELGLRAWGSAASKRRFACFTFCVFEFCMFILRLCF